MKHGDTPAESVSFILFIVQSRRASFLEKHIPHTSPENSVSVLTFAVV